MLVAAAADGLTAHPAHHNLLYYPRPLDDLFDTDGEQYQCALEMTEC
jgi:hypothetical protein